MRWRPWAGVLTLLTLVGAAGAQGQGRSALGTGFTFQGRLTVSGTPANGPFDFEFELFADPVGTTAVGNPIFFEDVSVTDGLFTMVLDFGSQFEGSARYVRTDVRPGASTGAYTPINPLARLSATPYSLYSLSIPLAGTGTAPSAAHSDHQHDALYWKQGGNAGTLAGTSFLGTTDNQALELKVDGARALRLEPNATSPNVLEGSASNSVTAAVMGAAIGGGGSSPSPNRVTDDFGTVGGGSDNQAGDNDGTTANNTYATVGGGQGNTASGYASTVGGGRGNSASGFASVGGGFGNTAAYGSTVGGGFNNSTTDAYATVGGGQSNTASAYACTVGGGQSNTASAYASTVGGGYLNTASGNYDMVGGGQGNSASGYASTVGGGTFNTAAGDYSLAAGRRAKAKHQGSFVWADSTDADFASTVNDQFAIRAAGGVRLVSNAGASKAVAVGELYRDNTLVAWAKVAANGTVTTDYGVVSVTHAGTGNYAITLNASAADNSSLVPVANAEIDSPPTSADTVRIVSIDQTGVSTFSVYINKGSGALVDNDFVFQVTAR
jgi:trimeric autotransporter adhesin